MGACACVLLAVAACAWSLAHWPWTTVRAGPGDFHGPLGVGQGIHPGRVVWVHAPEAVDGWAGLEAADRWYEHTDLAVVEEMMSQAVRGLTGETADAPAWEALFRHFNQRQGRGERGYQPGEKVAIKINLTVCNARGSTVNLTTYEKKSTYRNWVDNSPQMLVALLRQLVYVAGVAPADISVGDPTGLFAKHLYDPIHQEFPEVRCFDNYGGSGRVRTHFSTVPFHWSTAAADGKLADYVPVPFAEAAYIINFAVLKGHSAGITVCAKNHYGSLLRCPDGYLRSAGIVDYFDLHLSLPNKGWSPGMGHYRALVDLMGHRELGGKTLLYLIDGLFGGYYWEGKPYPWKMPPFGDGTKGDWPKSLFASQDPVAIDSVAYDFLLQEWPDVVSGGVDEPGSLEGGAEDYLHEAALAGAASGTSYDPEKDGTALTSLGVHEHWNNPMDRQYSRNLGGTEGIELVALPASRPEPRLSVRREENGMAVFSWRASLTGYHLEATADLAAPSWGPVAEAPGYDRALSVLTNPVSGAQRYYRLAQ